MIKEHHYETAFQNGIRRQIVHKRVFSLGWTVEDAVTTKVPLEPRQFFTNEELVTMEWFGISMDTARARIEVHGWTRENAVTTPTKKRRNDK